MNGFLSLQKLGRSILYSKPSALISFRVHVKEKTTLLSLYHSFLFKDIQKMYQSDNFLEYENVKNEKDYHLGDLILTFTNPDYNDETTPITIQFEQALKIFQDTFPRTQSRRKNDLFERVFKLAFVDLKKQENYYPNVSLNKKKRKLHQLRDLQGYLESNIYIDRNLIRIDGQAERLWKNGGFLQKQGQNWVYQNSQVADCMTLLRSIILYRLSEECGFYIRQFISSCGKKIFAVLYLDQNNLMIHSDKFFFKQIKQSFCDILSVEPIDKNLRPLRLHSYVNGQINNEGEQDELRVEIQRKLQELDLEKIFRTIGKRECQKKHEIRGETKISKKEWQFFNQFLENLYYPLQMIKKKYSDLNSTINLGKNDISFIRQLTYKQNSFKYRSQKEYNELIIEKQNQYPYYLNKKIVKIYNQNQMSDELQIAFESAFTAIQKYNFVKKTVNLHNIWTYLGYYSSLSPYVEHSLPNKHNTFKSYIKQQLMIKKTNYTENGKKSIFSKGERSNISYDIIQKQLNLYNLQQLGVIKDVFALNDCYELYGQRNQKYLSSILDNQLKTSLRSLIKYSRRKKLNENRRNSQQNIKGGLDGKNIKEAWKFYNVTQIPILLIRDYYGENVAKYLHFHSFYLQKLLILIFIGIIPFIVEDSYNQTGSIYNISVIIHSLVLTVFFSFLQCDWKFENRILNEIYGFKFTQETLNIRNGCKGNKGRSLTDDQLNVVYTNQKKSLILLYINMIVIMLLTVVQIFIIMGFFFLIAKLKNEQLVNQNFFNPNVTLLSLIWLIYTSGSEYFFKRMANYMTKVENWKEKDTFEFYFAYKLLIFDIFNVLGPPMMIIYFQNYIDKCLTDNCIDYLTTYIQTQFLIQFGQNIIHVLVYILKIYWTSYKRKKQKQKQIDHKDRYDPLCSFDYVQPRGKRDIYETVNNYIEDEANKPSVQEFEDIDIFVYNYVRIIINMAWNLNFGTFFPILCIPSSLFFIISLVQIRHQLIYYNQRPSLKSNKENNYVESMIELILYMYFLLDSFNISYLYTEYDRSQKLQVFILFLMLKFIIYFVITQTYKGKDSSTTQIIKRHQYIKKKLFYKVHKKQILQNKKNTPIFSVFGCINQKQLDEKIKVQNMNRIIL